MYITSPIRRFFVAGKAQQEADAYWARQEAYNYAEIFPERHRRQIAFTAQHLLSRMKSTDHVIDLGCADGWHSLVIAPHCASLHGYDYNPKFVELAASSAAAQDLKHVTFDVADVLTLKFPPASVDVVVLSGLLTYLVQDSAARQVLDLAANALKPGGFVLFKDTLHKHEGVSFNIQNGYGASYRDLATYRALAAKSGFNFSAEEWIDDGKDYGSLMAFAVKADA